MRKILVRGEHNICEIFTENPQWQKDVKLILAAPLMLRVLRSIPIDDIEKISSETAENIRNAIKEAT